jgi:hypothetical protein
VIEGNSLVAVCIGLVFIFRAMDNLTGRCRASTMSLMLESTISLMLENETNISELMGLILKRLDRIEKEINEKT